MKFSAARYYVQSLRTIATELKWQTLWPILMKRPVKLHLKSGLRLWVTEPMDVWVVKEVLLDRDYERYFSIEKGERIVDIGASLGDFSIDAALRGAEVFAYEMNAAEMGLMKKI